MLDKQNEGLVGISRRGNRPGNTILTEVSKTFWRPFASCVLVIYRRNYTRFLEQWKRREETGAKRERGRVYAETRTTGAAKIRGISQLDGL